jgi:integrase
MSEGIKVSVFKYPDRTNLVLGYDDPITDKRVTKSAKTSDEQQANRAAAVWEDELRSGRFHAASKVTWEEFTTRYKAEKVSTMARSSQRNVDVSLGYVKKTIAPDRLAKLTPAVMSQFQAKLRQQGMKDTTLTAHLKTIKAALRWAERIGMISKAPRIDMPKVAKGQTMMKGRPITGEEFDRFFAAVPGDRPDDAPAWQTLLTGLWLSGLRLGESLELSWDDDAPFFVDLSGKRPVFRILAAAQKARRDELLPMTPDFAEWLLSTFPEAQRVGKVFKLTNPGGPAFNAHTVGMIISDIGEAANVVVNKTAGKFASAHDLRRAFGTRWAKQVTTAILQRLMRHSDIRTTMKYYVGANAADIAEDLWQQFGKAPQGNILGNTTQKKCQNPADSANTVSD